MRNTSIFPGILTMISNFKIFLTYLFKIFLGKYDRFLHFHMIPAALLLITFFFFFLKLIIFIVYFLKNSKKKINYATFTSIYIMPIFYDNIEGIENSDGICLLIFVVDEFSGLFLHPLIFSVIHSRSA